MGPVANICLEERISFRINIMPEKKEDIKIRYLSELKELDAYFPMQDFLGRPIMGIVHQDDSDSGKVYFDAWQTENSPVQLFAIPKEAFGFMETHELIKGLNIYMTDFNIPIAYVQINPIRQKMWENDKNINYVLGKKL